MTCDRVRRRLPDYLDEALAPGPRFAVQAHLEACRACARECEAQQQLLELLARVPRRPLEPDWDAALYARLAALEHGGAERRRAGSPPHFRAVWRLALVPAAAAVLLLALWRPEPPPAPVVSATERAYMSRLVGQHVAGARARDLPEQEAVEVALTASSLASLIE